MKCIQSLSIALAVPFLFATPQVSLAQDAKVDQQYIAFLHASLLEVDPLSHRLAKEQFSDQENIENAQLMCKSFNHGFTFEQVTNMLQQGMEQSPDYEKLSSTQQEALSNYFGAVIYASTVYYCPEHRAQVELANQ